MNVTRSSYFRCVVVLLIAALLGGSWSSLASAEDTVTGISLDQSSVQLYVDDGAKKLNLTASLQSGSTPQNVTSLATWTSSSSSVKVDKGDLTAVGEASNVTITAKYKTFTATATVQADYLFEQLKLKRGGVDADSTMAVELDDDISFEAFASSDYGDVTDDAVWTSSNSAVATVSDGDVSLVGAGSAIVTAKFKGRSDTVTLNVTSPYSDLTISSNPAIDGSIEMNVGEGTRTLAAIATLKAGGTESVTAEATWTTSNPAVVKVDKGVVTAVSAGSAVVTAKRYGVSDSITFYVRTFYEGMKLTSDDPLSLTLHAAPIAVRAHVFKGTATPVEITGEPEAEWKIADPLFAAIEKTGSTLRVAPRGVGSTTLTVTYKGLSKSLPVTIFPTISTVDIVKSELDVFVEDMGPLPQVNGTTVGGDTIDIAKLARWTSADPTIVAIEDGKWKALKTGTVKLKAEVSNEAGTDVRTDTIDVTVHKKIAALAAQTANLSIVTGTEVAFPAVTAIFSDGEEEVVTDDIVWKSSTTNALVKGTKVKGLMPASGTLTGTYLGKTVSVKVVVEEKFESIKVEPSSLSLSLKSSQTIKVTATTVSGKKINIGSRITWDASAEDLVQIKGASIKGLAEGSGKLTAKVQGKSLEIPFTVKAKLTKLTVSAASVKMAVGNTENITLTATYENGKTADVTVAAGWTTSKASVAVLKDGVIAAKAKGTSILKATYGGKSATVRVTVQ